LRIGFGVDKVHSDQGVRPVIAGEVIEGHPPGNESKDLLLGAMGDALLGALGQGGLSEFLKKSDYGKNATLEQIFKDIERQLYYAGWKILNTDITVAFPTNISLTPDTQKIIKKIADNLFINPEQVNVKWKFSKLIPEVLNFYECYVVALIGPRNS